MSHWPAYIVPRINQIFTRDLTGSSIKGISGMNGAASAEALARERRLSYMKAITWTKLEIFKRNMIQGMVTGLIIKYNQYLRQKMIFKYDEISVLLDISV